MAHFSYKWAIFLIFITFDTSLEGLSQKFSDLPIRKIRIYKNHSIERIFTHAGPHYFDMEACPLSPWIYQENTEPIW